MHCAMQVVKVHKMRIVAIAIAMATLVLLVSVATIGHPQVLDGEWIYGGDTARSQQNDSLWRFRYNLLDSDTEVGHSVLPNWTSVLTPVPAEDGNDTKTLEVQSPSSFHLERNELNGHQEITADDDFYNDEKYSENDGPDDEVLGEYDDGNDNVIEEYDDYGSDSDDDDDENDNGVFRDGDFDASAVNNASQQQAMEGTSREDHFGDGTLTKNLTNDTNNKSSAEYYETHDFFQSNNRIGDRKLHSETSALVRDSPSKTSVKNSQPLRLVKRGTRVNPVSEGIFWSSQLEHLAPKGHSDQYVEWYLSHVRNLQVTNMSAPTWNRCGRPKNQYVTLSDGLHVCARYRAPHNYLVQGEVMSFYLARLLGIYNVPIVVLSKVDFNSKQWSGSLSNVTMEVIATDAGWEENATVAFIQWIDDLERDRMPDILLNALKSWKTISVGTKKLFSLSIDRLVELLQWSDLIVFDYITGNYDRVASMQDAADKEERPEIMHDTIHNLVKSRKTHGLWFIDNESGLLDAYSLMYARNAVVSQGKRFVEFHLQMLRTMCIFRKSTFDRIVSLRESRSAHKMLLDYVNREEPLFGQLSDLANEVGFEKHFQHRINEVYEWMVHCKRHSKKFSRSSWVTH